MSVAPSPTPYWGVSVAAATQRSESQSTSPTLNTPDVPISLQARRWQRALSQARKGSIEELTFNDLIELQENGIIGPTDIKDLLGDEWLESIRIIGGNLQQHLAEVLIGLERIVADMVVGLPHFDGTVSIGQPIRLSEEPSAPLEEDIDMDSAELERILDRHHNSVKALIGADLGPVVSEIARLTGHLENTVDAVDSISVDLKQLSGHFQTLSTQIAVQQEQIATVIRRADEDRALLTDTHDKVDNLHLDITKEVAGISVRLERLDTTIKLAGAAVILLVPVGIAIAEFLTRA